MRRALLSLLLLATLMPSVRADERTQRLVERLAEEAYSFGRLAPQVLGTETLEQRAVKPPSRFRLRLRRSDREQKPNWQQRRLESEYGFTTFAEDGALHELRQVRLVDGKPVKNAMSPKELARIVTATNDERKLELLKQFEEYGLLGAANDFGQIIMLFAPGSIERYEFVFDRPAQQSGVAYDVFRYQQLDGPEALTVVNTRRDKTETLRIHGEVWVTEQDYLPAKVIINVSQLDRVETVRQSATVEYQMSQHGALLPVRTDHQEFRGGVLAAENHFRYQDFQKFSASSELSFEILEQGGSSSK